MVIRSVVSRLEEGTSLDDDSPLPYKLVALRSRRKATEIMRGAKSKLAWTELCIHGGTGKQARRKAAFASSGLLADLAYTKNVDPPTTPSVQSLPVQITKKDIRIRHGSAGCEFYDVSCKSINSYLVLEKFVAYTVLP
jgi:hypothetical protein